MICLDKNSKIVIHTDMPEELIYELHYMKKSVLKLLATQDTDFHDRDDNYWAFKLVELLEIEPEQINIKNLE